MLPCSAVAGVPVSCSRVRFEAGLGQLLANSRAALEPLLIAASAWAWAFSCLQCANSMSWSLLGAPAARPRLCNFCASTCVSDSRRVRPEPPSAHQFRALNFCEERAWDTHVYVCRTGCRLAAIRSELHRCLHHSNLLTAQRCTAWSSSYPSCVSCLIPRCSAGNCHTRSI